MDQIDLIYTYNLSDFSEACLGNTEMKWNPITIMTMKGKLYDTTFYLPRVVLLLKNMDEISLLYATNIIIWYHNYEVENLTVSFLMSHIEGHVKK